MLSLQQNTYSRSATAGYVVHCTRQGDEIKKKTCYVLIVGFFNWLYCNDCM